MDLPGWQAVYEELKDHGFTVISISFDKDPEDARPWIEGAKPAHPSVIDARHVVADLYHMVNIPTVVWIDEKGRIARPNDVAFAQNAFKSMTGLDAEDHKRELRDWVTGKTHPLSPEQVREHMEHPTPQDQEARAEYMLGRYLWEQGKKDAAERHFQRGGELAPHNFMIRRGTMPMRGVDPMGPEFGKMMSDWRKAGNEYYHPLKL